MSARIAKYYHQHPGLYDPLWIDASSQNERAWAGLVRIGSFTLGVELLYCFVQVNHDVQSFKHLTPVLLMIIFLFETEISSYFCYVGHL